MRSFLKMVVLVPLAIVAACFCFANRHPVTVSFDPFSDVPAFALTGPLFVVILLVIGAGVILGSIATWLTQGRHRRTLRLAIRDADELRVENARLKTELAVARRGDGDLVAYPALTAGQHAA